MSKNPHSHVMVRKTTIPSCRKMNKTVQLADSTLPILDAIIVRSEKSDERSHEINRTSPAYPTLSKVKTYARYAGHRFYITRRADCVEVMHLGPVPSLF